MAAPGLGDYFRLLAIQAGMGRLAKRRRFPVFG